MDPFQIETESTFKISDWAAIEPNLVAGFTTRLGGVSPSPYNSLNLGLHVKDAYQNVMDNRRIVSQKVGIPLESWVVGEQVHGINVKVVSQSHIGSGALDHNHSIKNIDGLITNQQRIFCTAFFADCVPLYFFDPISRWIGIAHAGWRGTVNGMAKQMVLALLKQNVDIHSLLVAIGPCISKRYYEVDDNVINHIPINWKEDVTKPTKNGHSLLDLQLLNKKFLLESGVQAQNIGTTNYCTYENQELFFSHRRDNGNTGRMIGFIGFNAK